ncbi:MAG TPA: asparagine synthase (glutamine-hydrolyzing) [Polyangia bacterium]|nr:asparagine synthase (glutamine-hydrolyzing) [Polyangia bacterium]
MCGICGRLDRAHAGAPEGGVRAMMDALAHRGPDAAGLYRAGPVALGHRRLSIIDLRPEGRQPLASEDGSIVLVANGEIYNFRELRAGLERRGHQLRSRSDSEVIVHLYEEEGLECLARLRGMFAFALWDAPRRRLFLARDRAGEKPLYYAARDGALWFASELGALVRGLPWRPGVDLAAIDEYLTLQYVPAPWTAFEGVRKLPAAHFLTVSPGGAPRVERWWRLRFGPARPVRADDAVAETRALVEDAVAVRRAADVPLGAFLSGGIDSSTVVALLARGSSQPVKTFSVDLPAGCGGEAAYARLVARRYRTEHHELTLAPHMVSILPRLVARYGEPFADPSAVPTFHVSELARRQVTVALSGDGGDEAFAGYHRYAIEELARRVGRLPWPLPELTHAILARLPGARLRPAREFAAHRRRAPVERYLFLLAHFTRRDKERLIGPALVEHARRDRAARELERVLAASDAEDPVNRLLDLDTQTYLPDDIFTKVDIASMAHALEVRAPFCDHLLLERIAQFPGALKLRWFRGKQLLRRAVRDLLPAPILTRAKKGFGLPLDRWLREELVELSRDVLTDGTAGARGLFDAKQVRRLLDEHAAGTSHGRRLWNLTVLELWFRQCVDGGSAVAACSA